MKIHTRMLLCIVSLCLLLPSNQAQAQVNDDQDRHTWVGGDGNWSVDENWSDFLGPDAGAPDEDRWAQLGSGTVTVDGTLETGAVSMGRGTLAIGQGRSLTVAPSDFTNGVFDTGASGTLMLTGNGSFNGTELIGDGTIHLEGPNAQFALSGDLDFGGEVRVGVTNAGGASLDVNGNVKLTGTVAPVIDFQPELGNSFDFITGADSIDVSAAQLLLPSSVSLGRGIGAVVETSGSTAAVTIRNLPVLSIDRATGDTQIVNVVGDAIELTGYSLFSENGLLQVSGWNSLAAQSVDGWAEANPRDEAIGELNVGSPSSLDAGSAVSIGTPYKSGNIRPNDEDVEFLASLADGSVVSGIVEYTGAPNDLTLRVDPETGDAEISHLSNFVDPVDITGYSILSENGSLTPDSWAGFNSGDDGWLAANPKATAIAEFSPAATSSFSNGVEVSLGKIFTPGSPQDLVFEFAAAGGTEVAVGTVVYEALDLVGGGGGCQAPNALGGDLDGNGKVEFADFLVMSSTFGTSVSRYEDGDIDCNGNVEFADFLVLSDNFGSSLGAEASTSAVPEPSCIFLLGMGLFGLMFTRRRKSTRG